MGAMLVPVILIVIAIVVVVVLTRRLGQAQNRRVAHLESDSTPALRYHVPPGQDPAVVLNALRRAGYQTSPDRTGVELLIGTDGSVADRERAREVLSGVRELNTEGDPMPSTRQRVRFADE